MERMKVEKAVSQQGESLMPSSNVVNIDQYIAERKARSCGENWTEKSLPHERTIDEAKNVSHLQGGNPHSGFQ